MAPAHVGILDVGCAVEFHLQSVLKVLHDSSVDVDAHEPQPEAFAAVLARQTVVFIGANDVSAKLRHGGYVAALPLGTGQEFALKGLIRGVEKCFIVGACGLACSERNVAEKQG